MAETVNRTKVRGEVHAEYFLRTLGADRYVMFFTRGPSNDVRAAIPAVFEMGHRQTPLNIGCALIFCIRRHPGLFTTNRSSN